MYSRCPGCHTVHPVNALLLAQAGGKYRCGKCNQANDALECLFDEWPDPGDSPPESGELPVLGVSIDLAAAKQARPAPGETSAPTGEKGGNDQDTASSERTLRAAWITIAIALSILVTAYLAEYFQQPLQDSPGVPVTRGNSGPGDQSPTVLLSDLDQIQLVSRQLRSRPDGLNLSATIVNRAPVSQPFPRLEVSLLDSVGQTLITHLFEPNEYLPEDADIETGMTPQAYLHINLDLTDPGQQAVGFELNFR